LFLAKLAFLQPVKEFINDKNQVIINTPNQVWSTDITYIKLEKGHVYLATIIH
jgi:hypothetical protein